MNYNEVLNQFVLHYFSILQKFCTFAFTFQQDDIEDDVIIESVEDIDSE